MTPKVHGILNIVNLSIILQNSIVLKCNTLNTLNKPSFQQRPHQAWFHTMSIRHLKILLGSRGIYLLCIALRLIIKTFYFLLNLLYIRATY